jgi:MinD-like ATPase involved in chromosome partitioning or flagellar assembly
MTTITFYSYKGGTGRSLALANAAVYLANLGFKVVAIDFDLEAPGMHYKLSRSADGSPLVVRNGVVDFVNTYLDSGQVDSPITDFIVEAPVSDVDKHLVHLVPAGKVPSHDYWSKLSRINWHELFYSENAVGVQIFMELRARILEELKPDFVLIDSRTGITEMSGVATTLLADKVICLVLPTPENLDGARAVLRSLSRTRRESNGDALEVLIALSRLPHTANWHDDEESAAGILKFMNEPADCLEDTLSCEQVFVLHSEPALQIREELRVGSGTNPDDSVLLRDYLRLFANFVPKESIEPKLRDLIEKAWNKLRDEPDEAVKEMEELAESFNHPETYRELLRFYQVRNVSGIPTLRRAQRLWELTEESDDPIIWQAIVRSFEPQPRWRRAEKQWSPNLDFIQSVWWNAGGKNAAFGMKLADAYAQEDRDSVAADIVLEIIKSSEPTATIVARCITLLDYAKRTPEADALIQQVKERFSATPEFANAWARHAIRVKSKAAIEEIAQTPWIDRLRPSLKAIIYASVGRLEDAVSDVESLIRDIREREVNSSELEELGKIFHAAGRWDEFEGVANAMYPTEMVRGIRDSVGVRPRRKVLQSERRL